MGKSNKINKKAAEPDLEYIIEKLAAMHTITIEFLAHPAQTKALDSERAS